MSDTSSVPSGLLSFTPEYQIPTMIGGGQKDTYIFIAVVLVIVFLGYCSCSNPLPEALRKIFKRNPPAQEENFGSVRRASRTRKF